MTLVNICCFLSRRTDARMFAYILNLVKCKDVNFENVNILLFVLTE